MKVNTFSVSFVIRLTFTISDSILKLYTGGENMTQGQRIAELRKSKKMSQSELSKAIHVSPSTIGMWETDNRAIKDDDLVKLADLFNVTTDYLLGRTDNRHEDILAAAHLDEDINKMSPEQRRAIYDFIEFQKQKIDEDNKKD